MTVVSGLAPEVRRANGNAFILEAREHVNRQRGIGQKPEVLRMSHAIIRGKNGRRHEVDFGDDPIRVEVYASDETVEIFVEADVETLPEQNRRFASINIPRQLFSQATGEAARRANKKRG